MRLFVAIDIPEDVKEALHSFVRRLKPLARISWSRVENLHITTKFIGEWPESRLNEMTSALEAVPTTGPIDISVRGIGWFPDEKRPRVFWAGIEASESLRALASSTEQAVAALGIPVEDRTFSPHLTLARIRESVPMGELFKAIKGTPAEFGSFQATEYFLYLSAEGKYTKLARFSLS